LRIADNRTPNRTNFVKIEKNIAVYMLDFDTLNHLSRCHCVSICAALVPANLLVCSAIILLTGTDRSLQARRWLAVVGAGFFALLLAHVASWWLIGVVAPATFILPSLGLLCSVINWSCLKHEKIMAHYIQSLVLSRFNWERA
jgi:prepilin signal peptidase PulO-like enzyme (type II secretory pathway)